MRQFILFILFVVLVYACSRTCQSDYGTPVKSPVDDLIKEMADVPSYSIILNDMNTEGTFFKKYLHQYRIIETDQSGDPEEKTTDWYPVSKDFFLANMDNMGMEIASKDSTGKVSKAVGPPGYGAYVGNQRYGHWVNRDGGSFWEFYGKYALMSSMFHMMTYPARMSYWNDYHSNYYGTGRSYYGPRVNGNYVYGTNSQYGRSVKSNSTWFNNASNNSFRQRVRSGVSQSSKSGSRYSNFSRSRSGGFGK